MQKTKVIYIYYFDIYKDKFIKQRKVCYIGHHHWLNDNEFAYFPSKTDRDYEYEWLCLDENIDQVDDSIGNGVYVIYSFDKNVNCKKIIMEYISKKRNEMLNKYSSIESALINLNEKENK